MEKLVEKIRKTEMKRLLRSQSAALDAATRRTATAPRATQAAGERAGRLVIAASVPRRPGGGNEGRQRRRPGEEEPLSECRAGGAQRRRLVLVLDADGDDLRPVPRAVQVTLPRLLAGRPAVLPPPETMLGALLHYVHHADVRHFQPMNANFGLLPPLESPSRDKRQRKTQLAERALAAIETFAGDVAGVTS